MILLSYPCDGNRKSLCATRKELAYRSKVEIRYYVIPLLAKIIFGIRLKVGKFRAFSLPSWNFRDIRIRSTGPLIRKLGKFYNILAKGPGGKKEKNERRKQRKSETRVFYASCLQETGNLTRKTRRQASVKTRRAGQPLFAVAFHDGQRFPKMAGHRGCVRFMSRRAAHLISHEKLHVQLCPRCRPVASTSHTTRNVHSFITLSSRTTWRHPKWPFPKWPRAPHTSHRCRP